jgi:hypothetical protein
MLGVPVGPGSGFVRVVGGGTAVLTLLGTTRRESTGGGVMPNGVYKETLADLSDG